MDEPLTNENIPSFLLNAIIDDNIGDLDITALIHGIEVLKNKVNAITCPKTGKQLEYCNLIQDPATKAVWNPAMDTEVYRLVSTETNIFLRKKNIPQGEKSVYTRLVVDLRPNKAVHERLKCAWEDKRWKA